MSSTLRVKLSFPASSLLQHSASENRPAAQRSVEAIERHRGHEQDSSQADACIPCRPLGRQGEVRQETEEDPCGHQSQQSEADQ